MAETVHDLLFDPPATSSHSKQVLSQEAKRFDGIDAAWKKIMAETARNPVVLEACGTEGRLAQLQSLSEQLEACQKSLSEYIEMKRCAFTRYAASVSAFLLTFHLVIHASQVHPITLVLPMGSSSPL